MPEPTTDHALLTQFLDTRSDEAFGRLVARHGGFVRAIALRRVRGDHHLAEDVTQAVFIVLMRRVKVAARSTSLRGWLHATTCYAASNALRAASRRGRREANVERIDPTIADDPAALASANDEWAAIDVALCSLGTKDRNALMLHYADGKTLPEVAAALGTTNEAAKKRVQRARERLRSIITRRGVRPSIVEHLPALAIVPMSSDGMTLAGGLDGRAFVIAKKVVTAMKLQTIKVAAGIAIAVTLAIGGTAIVVAQVGQARNIPAGPGVILAAAPQPLLATLSDDVRVELLGVCSQSDPDKWWAPDGTPLDAPPA